MPIVNAKEVQMQPMYAQSCMSLEDLRAGMAARPPALDGRVGGWANTSNAGSNLGKIGLAPPPSMPEILDGAGDVPRRLLARFYYWNAAPSSTKQDSAIETDKYRTLGAVDVIVSQDDSEHLNIFWSTRRSEILNRRKGPLVSLEEILRGQDDSMRIQRSSSAFALYDADIFLWLTLRRRDDTQLTPIIRLDDVSGVVGRDGANRRSELWAGVDFGRANFLTAVAESDTLGPMEISFAHSTVEEHRSYKILLHLDGGFKVRKKGWVRIPSLVDAEDLMMTAVHELAYKLIPSINAAYEHDGQSWQEVKSRAIEGAMTDLEGRYRDMKQALIDRRDRPPE